MTKRMLILILALFLIWPMVKATADDSEKQSVAAVLYELVNQKGVDVALRKYYQLKKTNNKQYDFSEPELNKLGYRLLGEKKRSAAIAIFKLNAEVHSGSPNAYDSLGEAYMRDGDNEMAIISYEKSLAMLATADIDEKSRKLLARNANSRLSHLRHPESARESTVISDFISNNADAPFGKIHPEAPPETKQFGQLAGVWQCTNFAYVNGQWFSGWPATWVWKYSLDGFAVQDLWFQKREDLPPTSTLNRAVAGTNIRIYNPQKKKWEIAWFTNGSNSMSRLEAEFKNNEIVMTPLPVEGKPLRRIVFYEIAKDSFQWRSERSADGGETWSANFRIEGKRIR